MLIYIACLSEHTLMADFNYFNALESRSLKTLAADFKKKIPQYNS